MPENTISPTGRSRRAKNRVYAQLKDDEFRYFQKAKEKIRLTLVEQHICLPNQNISQTEVLKVLVNFYCNEKKIA